MTRMVRLTRRERSGRDGMPVAINPRHILLVDLALEAAS